MNIRQAVSQATNTRSKDREFIDGPETGVGVEYWLRHKDGREAYVCDDQGVVNIQVTRPIQEKEP
jgi:hypothetical protein